MRHLPHQKDFLCTHQRNDVILFIPNIPDVTDMGKNLGCFQCKMTTRGFTGCISTTSPMVVLPLGLTQGMQRCLCSQDRAEGCPRGQKPCSGPAVSQGPASVLRSLSQPCHQGSFTSLLIPAPPAAGFGGNCGVQDPFSPGYPFPGCCPRAPGLDFTPCAPAAQPRVLGCEQRL